MTPEQFLAKIAKQPSSPVYLFLGPESYQRRQCKEALLAKALPGELRVEGLTQIDLENSTLQTVLDDACSLSLFATSRVIWVSSAEAALPRRLSSASDSDEDDKPSPGGDLANYLKSPTPGTVIVFEASRYDFIGEDKAKLERVEKFYSAIPDRVEFRPFTPELVRYLAQDLAKQNRLQLGTAELAMLLEAIGGDAARLASEIEKLSLFVGSERRVTAEDIRALVPNASQTTIFNLVGALGRKNRAQALKSLDVLIREGEYLPLALTFLSTQFRLALAAKEAGLNNTQQAQTYFTKQGIRMWRDRAEQLMQTASAFDLPQLRKAITQIYDADKALRDTRPDDRTVMEAFVMSLT